MSKPLISCKMITYGRVEFLEESLYSFIKQEYDGDKELIIVNDYPKQKLYFNHPQVKIYNLDETFKTLGEKENYATSLCQGEIICQWDDDDLALSNHLDNVHKYFTPGSDLLHWHKAVMMNMPDIAGIIGVGNSGIVYSKSIWEKIGGYPKENAGYDMSYVVAIKTASPHIVFAAPEDNDVSWIYVWGGRGYHCSGMGTDDGSRPDVIQRHSAYIESQRVAGKIPTGDIYLRPHWKYDYSRKLKDFIRDRK